MVAIWPFLKQFARNNMIWPIFWPFQILKKNCFCYDYFVKFLQMKQHCMIFQNLLDLFCLIFIEIMAYICPFLPLENLGFFISTCGQIWSFFKKKLVPGNPIAKCLPKIQTTLLKPQKKFKKIEPIFFEQKLHFSLHNRKKKYVLSF